MKRYKSLYENNKNDSKFKELYNKLLNMYGKEIEKSEYIGSCRAHDCDKNSYKQRKNYQVYKGHILFYDPNYKDWTWTQHIFNVDKNGKVIEFTDISYIRGDGEERFQNTYYFGKPYIGKLGDIWK